MLESYGIIRAGLQYKNMRNIGAWESGKRYKIRSRSNIYKRHVKNKFKALFNGFLEPI